MPGFAPCGGRSALGLIDRNEPAEQVIAAKLIELAQQGERDPDRLAYRVLAIIDAASLAQSDPSPRGKAKGHE
jgi:hypothetical protein